jgi:hypothetical protein
MGFSGIDPNTGNAVVGGVSNVLTNFGWEYVWHCHLLGHEEMDMMRPMCVNVAAGSYIIPNAPTNVVATAGAGQATITFNAPPSNGSAITRYIVTAIPATGSVLGTDITTSATSRTRTISGLTPGVSYTFTVAAQSAAGTGLSSAPSNSVTITAAAAPTAPTGLRTTTISTNYVILSWTNTAGTNASGFYIDRSPNGTTGWIRVGSTAAGTLTFRNTGLTTRTTYYYRVQAWNATGVSTFATLSVTTR